MLWNPDEYRPESVLLCPEYFKLWYTTKETVNWGVRLGGGEGGESAYCQQTDNEPCHILTFLQKITYFISENLL